MASSSSSAVAAAEEKMANLSLEQQSSSSKGTAKRDALRANEIAVQKIWETAKVFESNPNNDNKNNSFMVTFPYPYSNGHLHIGHAFSLTKAVFRAQYERHQGKNVLFPFAFHCTGMPIQAVRHPNISQCSSALDMILFSHPCDLYTSLMLFLDTTFSSLDYAGCQQAKDRN